MLLAGAWSDLTCEVLCDRIATVMIASPEHARWGSAQRRKKTAVSLEEAAAEVVCVLARDLHGVLAQLPKPKPGGSRILVENYSSAVALVRANAGIGFVPELDVDSALSGSDRAGLEVYPVSNPLPLRHLAVWLRTGEPAPEEVEALLRAAREHLP